MKKDPRQSSDRLISGKLRPKAARGGAKHTIVAVDGVDYVWARRHSWYIRGTGTKALSISVSLRPERTRELILEFALPTDTADGSKSEVAVSSAIADGIRQACAAGWDPESRGRAFRFTVGDVAGEDD